jgi:hypothetical protein
MRNGFGIEKDIDGKVIYSGNWNDDVAEEKRERKESRMGMY